MRDPMKLDPNFEPKNALGACMLGYLKRGDAFLAKIDTTKTGIFDDASNALRQRLGRGKAQMALLLADMDGWTISPDFGEVAALEEGRECKSIAFTDRYINVRRSSHGHSDGRTAYAGNFTIYQSIVSRIWVQDSVHERILADMQMVADLRSGKTKRLEQQKVKDELAEARRLMTAAQAKVTEAEWRLRALKE